MLVAFALLVGGCGSPAESLVPVTGQVKFAGKPLTAGAVIFLPDTAKGNTTDREPRGNIGPDGRYTLVSHPDPGAPPGWYKVGVVANEPADPKNPYARTRSLIPEQLNNPAESGLTVEVRRNAPPGAYDLDLK
jgi:hypothetical protein